VTVSDLEARSLDTLARRIRSGQLSPVELVRHYLERIARHDGALHAFIEVHARQALDEATVAEQAIRDGHYRGALHGLPYGLKDNFHVLGRVTTAGSATGVVATEEASVVARLRRAGAILIGKTSLHELAFGPLGTNPHYGDVRNPWRGDRHSGGSSSGSAAAVAAGFCAFALGTDTTGSIRIPASFCGTVGLKPTYGLVSRAGVVPLAWTLDHVGVICHSVIDAATVLSAIAGPDERDPTTVSRAVPSYSSAACGDVSNLRIGVISDYVTASSTEVAAHFNRAIDRLRDLGAVVEKVAIPEAASTAAAAAAIVYAEALACHRDLVETRGDRLAGDVRERFSLARCVTGVDYVNAQRLRTLLIERCRDLFARFDVLASPTEPVTAPPFAEETIAVGGEVATKASVVTRFTRLFNLTGHPAMTLPCGFSDEGLPVGLQLVADHHAEAMLFRVGAAYQQATDWHHRIPALAS
jgi:aspartyl-tRNA(Asn)/glutamyl-tRNA(Gln) amidotransferase subunit A